MSIGNTDVDFKEIYNAINGAGAHTTQAIGMDSFYNQPFDDGTSNPSSGLIASTPSSGRIGIDDMKGKTIETSLYEWSKLDGIWTTANGTNCGRALEIGWFGNVHTNNLGITTGSSDAEQIQNIKDWLEEQNVIKGYTYYIGFSFHASYPTLPQVCKRTNGPDGAISAVSGLSTSYNSTWDLYYISNVFEIPNGIGNPLKGKFIEIIFNRENTTTNASFGSSLLKVYNSVFPYTWTLTSYTGDENAYKWVVNSDNSTPSALYAGIIYRSTNDGKPNSYSLIKFKVDRQIKLYFKQSSEINYDHVWVYVDNLLKGMLDMNNTPFPTTTTTSSLDDDSWHYLAIAASVTDKEVIIVYSKDGSVDVEPDKGYFYYEYT